MMIQWCITKHVIERTARNTPLMRHHVPCLNTYMYSRTSVSGICLQGVIYMFIIYLDLTSSNKRIYHTGVRVTGRVQAFASTRSFLGLEPQRGDFKLFRYMDWIYFFNHATMRRGAWRSSRTSGQANKSGCQFRGKRRVTTTTVIPRDSHLLHV